MQCKGLKKAHSQCCQLRWPIRPWDSGDFGDKIKTAVAEMHASLTPNHPLIERHRDNIIFDMGLDSQACWARGFTVARGMQIHKHDASAGRASFFNVT